MILEDLQQLEPSNWSVGEASELLSKGLFFFQLAYLVLNHAASNESRKWNPG